MMNIRTYRTLQNLLLMFTILILGLTFYFQYMKGLQPCPLCLMQRFCAFIFAFLCVIALSLSTLKRATFVAIFQMLFTFLGLLFATRQMWLQFFPAEHASVCLPGFDILIRQFPWQDVLHGLFWGAEECSAVTWRWLGFPMSVWAAVYFFVVFLTSVRVFFLLRRSLIRFDVS